MSDFYENLHVRSIVMSVVIESKVGGFLATLLTAVTPYAFEGGAGESPPVVKVEADAGNPASSPAPRPRMIRMLSRWPIEFFFS